jgi:nucleotide sugar dehydrogenase
MHADDTVAILGLGYVGLPLARAVCDAVGRVIGFDVSENVVAGLRSAHSHIDDVGDAEIALMLGRGFQPTADESALKDATEFIICVPTPLSMDGRPDLAALMSACATIARHLKCGNLVVLESTTFPGTTEEVVLPLLEESGLRAGKDFSLAFSPERVDPGNEIFGIANTPKVVGGVTSSCTDRAVEFYQRFIGQVVPARGTREAEMAKLLENTYRHINIALVNELAQVCHEMGINVWDVIRCASTKPFGFQAFEPGPGVGGHCIPIDPHYLSYSVRLKLGLPFRFVELAQEINSMMPHYVSRRVQDLLNDHGVALRGSRVLLVGITYKADIADQRESPANSLATRLRDQGAVLAYHDPFVAQWHPECGPVSRESDLAAAAAGADVVVVLQHHSSVDLEVLVKSGTHVLDTRGRLSGDKVIRL